MKKYMPTGENDKKMPDDGDIYNHKRDGRDNGADLFEIFSSLLRRKRLIFAITLTVMTLTTIWVLMLPNLYRSRCSILPTGQNDKFSELRKLAGLGSSSSDKNSSELYPVILQSQLILDAIMDHTYQFEDQGQSRTMNFSEYCSGDNRDIVRQRIASMINIASDFQTGVIYLSLESHFPGFSQAVLKKYLNELEDFNRHKRRSLARENVRYLSGELAHGEKQLQKAEDSLEAFQMVNRNWRESANPVIIKAISRLRRNIEIKAKVYAFLLEQYEAARLDEQKDTPIVRILDRPTLPLMKSAPKRTVTVLLAGLATLITMMLSVIVIEHIKRRSVQTAAHSLANLRNEINTAFPRSTRVLKLVHRIHKKDLVLKED